MGRELGADTAVDNDARETNGTSELHIRNMFDAWLHYMSSST